jgi:threonine aldolase
MTGLDFASDNHAPVHPAVMEAMARENDGAALPYGDDDASARMEALVAQLFGRACRVVAVTTGSAANGLALSLLAPPYGVILTHEAAHIQTGECGLPEFYTGGAKLLPIAGEMGKLTHDAVRAAGAQFGHGSPGTPPLAALSLTQATEMGAVYTPDDLAALSLTARDMGLKLHMDGARFANAVASTGASPAALSVEAGIDILSLGGTKNGGMAAELVVIFDPALVADVDRRRKRSGHLWSKARYLAVQWEALLTDSLWLHNARHANAMASRLSTALAGRPDVRIVGPVETNQIFAHLPDALAQRMHAGGALFHRWGASDQPGQSLYRLVTSWATQAEDVDALVALMEHPA